MALCVWYMVPLTLSHTQSRTKIRRTTVLVYSKAHWSLWDEWRKDKSHLESYKLKVDAKSGHWKSGSFAFSVNDQQCAVIICNIKLWNTHRTENKKKQSRHERAKEQERKRWWWRRRGRRRREQLKCYTCRNGQVIDKCYMGNGLL